MHPNSFSKAERILKRSEFILLSRDGKKIQNSYFLLIFCPGRYPKNRLGVTVSKKVGNAVARNRIKRHIREHFRIQKRAIIGNWDANIIARKNAAALTGEQIQAALADLWKRFLQQLENK